MKTADAIEHFKTPDVTGRKNLADVLTREGWPVSPEAISQWGEYPPVGRQYQIESLTNGELKATPRREATTDDVCRSKAG